MRRVLLVLALATAILPAGAAHGLPPVKHVFVVVLENKNYNETFGSATKAPYLARSLTSKGQLLRNYYGTSHASLGNYVTMVSGQAPNLATQGDCPIYMDVFPGTPAPNGQVRGLGCVYPRSVQTIADQLESRGLTWRGYMEDISRPCYHPAFGEIDPTQRAKKSGQYANRHNPFAYFRSIIDEPTCASRVVSLDRLPADLRSTATTPNFTYITPDLCSDGHDEPCVDGRPGGLASSDAFLRQWVPQILASPAYRKDGMLLVIFDEADSASSDACCGELPGPNTHSPGLNGPGGGRTGAVVISRYTRPGAVNATPYNHYALLRSLEDIFGLDHLGLAAAPGLRAFGADVFNSAAPKPGIKVLSVRRIAGCVPGHGKPLGTLRAARPRAGQTVVAVRISWRARLIASARSGRTLLRTKVRTIAACRRVRFGVPLTKGTFAVHARAGRTDATRTVRLHG